MKLTEDSTCPECGEEEETGIPLLAECPDEVGIHSPEGYIAVNDILQNKSFHGKHNLSDIERVVANNEKQRFKLRRNPTTHVLEIKANQGHSIKVSDLELVPILDPVYSEVVHGTYLKFWPQIKSVGLCRMKRLHIHLAKGIHGSNIISGIRKDVEIYIFIDLIKALDGGITFFESENGVILTPGDEKGCLNPQYFSKVIVATTGFPPYTQPQDLAREFSQFGNVKIEKVTPNYALMTYLSAPDAQKAIKASGVINVYGEYLTIKLYSKLSPNKGTKREFIRTKQKGIIVDPKEIDLSGDFNKQASQIVYTVRLTQDEANTISSLYYDVERVLQAQWPGCVATPFGSITTGLGIKSSDADCFVLVPDRFQHGNAHFVNKAKKILQSYPHIFAEILSIPRANTPIVKFFHVPTETNCDLSFKTPLGSQNSKLIAFMLHADPRLIPLAILIKYWAKVHDLSGTGKLTNYALTMMIIFFLQQPPAAILPSVAWLQIDRTNDYIVDYWNTGFMNNRELLPPSYNTLPVSDLLGGFFEYYAEFNFDELVICPYLGTPIKKEAFNDINQLPSVFERYKQNVTNGLVMPMRFGTAICVQDPFEQSHNVSSGISGRFSEDIRAFLKFAATAYQNEKSENCENFLRVILLQKPKITRAKTNPEFRVHLFPRIIANIVDPDWKSVVRGVIITIFNVILKLQLNKVEEKENQKSEESKKEREKYVGTIVKPIWKRKQFARLYSTMQLTFVDRHTRITEEIIKVDKNTSETHFQLLITFNSNPKSAVLSLKFLRGEGDAFREFGKFLTSVVLGWVSALVNPSGPGTNLQQNVNIKETIEEIDCNLDTSNDSDDDKAEAECDNLISRDTQKNHVSDNGPTNGDTLIAT